MSYFTKNVSKLSEIILNKTIKPARRKSRTLFTDSSSPPKIIHCGHHKVGTYWFARILGGIADHYGLNFQNCEQYQLKPDTDIFMEQHTYVDLSEFDNYIGSHLIRDPRDMVISGYYYHLWTNEDWAHLPQPNLGYISFQKYLKSLPQDEGISVEIKRTAKNINDMALWDYNNPRFFEIKYENLIQDEQAIFRNLFKHYGFTDDAIDIALNIAERFSFKNITKRSIGEKSEKSHLRSGKPGEWRTIFTDEHKNSFKELTGDALIKMGYEQNNDW